MFVIGNSKYSEYLFDEVRKGLMTKKEAKKIILKRIRLRRSCVKGVCILLQQ